MNPYILLGRILERFYGNGISKVNGYKGFEYIHETRSTVYVKRENGKEAPIAFEKIIDGIEAFQLKPELYNQGPSALRDYGITHITSPVWSLLHLLQIEDYEKKELARHQIKKISILDEHGILEHELELSWRIYELALNAYHHADYLFLKASEEEKRIISNSKSLKFLRVVCARTCILELSKLLTKGRNNHYSFWNLVVRLKKKRFVGNINISAETLSEIERSLFTNKDIIEKIKTIRDKVVAHDDSNNHLISRQIFNNLLPLLELTHSILSKLCIEQYQKVCPPEPKNDIRLDIFDHY
ncbi:hypothetical protein PP182_19980 [Maribacter sp. PR1]|uniref:HEPN AbiU2-like domain-containing protein n=1 Tax=Maribacter cobaltidurans TaxID=1178778 RepID=A0ABU7IZL5_9FLAO|nr:MULTISPECIES: hypothetical protein [Maribacter]MDC6390976.1 hypothetical protein [Maribacter sp. PR1]MEE1978368.1 hypothetical protein [Maribacter cobaltidurans]